MALIIRRKGKFYVIWDLLATKASLFGIFGDYIHNYFLSRSLINVSSIIFNRVRSLSSFDNQYIKTPSLRKMEIEFYPLVLFFLVDLFVW